ncbi:hypothetical protein [uncultured Methanobacterium sp.]|uniref:hypothetical protein n=1 Tax=uncultured Methanobacterium sp. TaxID=176306 RepID=UPI002AA7F4A2|nr:hypothetical protein [uncultured Methanobacterium sp.]
MDKKIIENAIFIIVGVAILLVVELQLIQFSEIIMIILGLIGFLALVNGAFGLYNALRHKK